MTWFENPIANMYGPHFLVLYGAVIGAVLLGSRWKIRASDPTMRMSPLSLPADPDPLAIAYLRGGENEATRVVIFDLVRRGYLEIMESPKERWKSKPEPRIAQAKKPA